MIWGKKIGSERGGLKSRFYTRPERPGKFFIRVTFFAFQARESRFTRFTIEMAFRRDFSVTIRPHYAYPFR